MQLVDLAYARVDMVARRGEFAVRGGILDVFPPTADHPVRVEFFGDEVEEVRSFSVADQRSLPEPIERVSLAPSRELLLTAPVRQRAREMVHEFPSLAGMLEKVAEGIPVEGMESLAPALLDRLVPLSHYLPEGAAVAVLAPERVAGRAVSLGETNREFLSAAWSAATAGAEAPIDLAAGDFLTVRQLRDAALFSAPGEPDPRRVWWNFSSFDIGDAAEVVASSEGDGAAAAATASTTVRLAANAMPSFQGNVAGAVDHAAERLRDGWSLVVASAGHGLVERARDVLAEAGLAARLVDEVPADLEPGVAYLVQADAARGYEVPEVKLGLIAEAEFYGRAAGYDARQGKKLASRRRNVVDPLQLKQGDYVVHQTHGIGRFVEMVQREVATGSRPTGPSRTAGIQQQPTAVREYLVLEYAPSKRGHAGDRLFVPTDQLDLLSRYVGGEAPSLQQDGRQRLGAGQGEGAQGGARHRGRARQALFGAHGGQGIRLQRRHPVAARARRGVPVRRDARPGADHRRGEGRHGASDPHGPAARRRCRLRQDRGGRACCVQGHPGRQAGRDARADDTARQAAPRDLQRALRGVPRARARTQPVPDRQRGARDGRGARRRHRRHGHRHAPHPDREGAVQGCRPR